MPKSGANRLKTQRRLPKEVAAGVKEIASRKKRTKKDLDAIDSFTVKRKRK